MEWRRPKADLPRDEARSLSLLAEALLVGPTPIEEGLERCASMTAKARGNQLLEAQVLLRAARLHAHLTKFDQARELNDRAKGILEELGLVSDVALAEWNGGVIEFLAGELGTAAMHLEIASRAFEGRGEGPIVQSRARIGGGLLCARQIRGRPGLDPIR